jgi:hypothetical protein
MVSYTSPTPNVETRSSKNSAAVSKIHLKDKKKSKNKTGVLAALKERDSDSSDDFEESESEEKPKKKVNKKKSRDLSDEEIYYTKADKSKLNLAIAKQKILEESRAADLKYLAEKAALTSKIVAPKTSLHASEAKSSKSTATKEKPY